MKRVNVAIFILLLVSLVSHAQQTVTATASVMVPPLIQFSNVATDEGGK
jgi:hypothetical protein